MCFEKYWNVSEILTTIDVDEFLYPCPHLWKSANVFDAVMNSYHEMYRNNTHFIGLPMTVEIECYKYGIQGMQNNPPPGSRTLDTYQYRTHYPDDFDLPINLSRTVKEACDSLKKPPLRFDFCESQGGKKHVYIPFSPSLHPNMTNSERQVEKWSRVESKSPLAKTQTFVPTIAHPVAQPKQPPSPGQFHDWLPILPSVHWYHGKSSNFPLLPKKNRRRPLCCNHYTMRSIEGLRAKGLKNRNLNEKVWMRINSSTHPVWSFWDLVLDDGAMRFYEMLKNNKDYKEL